MPRSSEYSSVPEEDAEDEGEKLLELSDSNIHLNLTGLKLQQHVTGFYTCDGDAPREGGLDQSSRSSPRSGSPDADLKYTTNS